MVGFSLNLKPTFLSGEEGAAGVSLPDPGAADVQRGGGVQRGGDPHRHWDRCSLSSCLQLGFTNHSFSMTLLSKATVRDFCNK